jgi:hypothetical protein
LTLDTSQNATFAGSVKTNTLTSAASTALTLQSAGTTAITVDTSQLVGIGTTSPSSYGGSLVVRKSNTGQGVTNATAQFSDAVNSSLWIGHGSGVANIVSEQAITFGNTNGSATTERMRINAGAPILCLAGGSTTATGTGIAFPATQSASSDANTLDDYEEGTFTPTVSSNTGSITTYTASGYYVKVGRTITITMFTQITVPGTAGGVLNFTSLPFTSLNPGFAAGNRSSTSAWREDAITGNFYFGYVAGGTTSGTITSSTNGAVSWTANAAYVSSFVYETAS